jgi:NodT family efflux transporter outer membrane factor (OMF) lipoprotein
MPIIRVKKGDFLLPLIRIAALRLTRARAAVFFAFFLILSASLCGCTGVKEYFQNGFKVGPNFCPPPAPVARDWIDAADRRVSKKPEDLSKWWTVFNDPALNNLICCAYHQNLTLREAGLRILQARAQLAIAKGELFPQNQNMTGEYNRNTLSQETANGKFINQPFFDQWNFGFNLNWELDFWGRFRRAVESNAAALNASIADYDEVLVTLLGDVALNYVQMRTLEERIRFAQANVQLQRQILTFAEARYRGGTADESDVFQARSTLEATEAQIYQFEISLRQTTNQLCILLGMPPEELRTRLGQKPIPTAPVAVAVGIPADLLRRRPDVRRAEWQAAAQCALIGVAEADFYPAFSLNGTLGYSAQNFPDLFRSTALNGNIGPSFQWNLLNYGRIANNVRYQDARFQELVVAYQQTVLTAAQEVENGLVTFLRAQQRTERQAASVRDTQSAVAIVLAKYKGGLIDFTRVDQLEQSLVQQEDVLAQSQGEIASGLIQVDAARGGGWEIRMTDCQPANLPPRVESAPAREKLPIPNPEPVPPPPPANK